MRRALVLTNESARHPFRASLPPHVCSADPVEIHADKPDWKLTTSDMRGFATVYFATFAAALAFIA